MLNVLLGSRRLKKACTNGWVKLVLDHHNVHSICWVSHARAEEFEHLALVARNWRKASSNGLS